ncbi:hypothetical protein [Ketobacter alkanivorans]|uniref:hypothetical protein n=1 Tax=Ketobacter alkanivorans TaxID=1917421 RepID=UPI001315A8EB|nr:hypothetical protein [Ketobacter alkanivorans]MCP5017170.1 hypothetical protein [Ketobacter sp.]
MNLAKYTVLLLVLIFSTQSFALIPPLRQIDAFKVISVEGEDVPWVLGWSLDELSLAAMVDGVMEPIPFQIDQYNTGGAIYFEGWHIPMSGSPNLMDGTDKILFLFKDAGPRLDPRVPFDGEMVAEVVTRDRDGVERFVYLVRNSRLRSEEQYVRYSAELGLVETDFYSLRYNKKNHLQWDDFSYVNYVGERPLDSMKLRLNTGILTSVTDTELNNNQMIALPTGEIIGPIRTTTQLDFNLYLFGVSILQLSMQIHHYPKSIMYDVRGIIPELRRKLLVDPSLTMSLDANRLLGAETRTSAWPDKFGTVDGVVDDNELKMIEAGLDPANNWLWVTSKRNLDILAFVDYLGDFNEPMALLYKDDLEKYEPPEVFPGQMPNVGYGITSFPMTGFIGFVVSLFVSDGYEGDPNEFAPYARTLPDLEVRAM